jgi:DNA-binding transcriptional MerR regulator
MCKQCGILSSKQTLWKYTRDGLIKAEKRSNKHGFRYDIAEVKRFIDSYQKTAGVNLLEAYENLKKENGQLRFEMSMPKDLRISGLLKTIAGLKAEILNLKEVSD